MKYLLLIILLLPLTVQASEPVWAQLERQCESDFAAYERKLETLRKQFDEEVARMSQKQYTELDLQSDPRFIFIALSWPSDLSEKDQFWKANQDCANVHWEARKSLRTFAASPAEKTAHVVDLKNCLLTRFDRTKIVAPFDQIIGCYEKRAARK